MTDLDPRLNAVRKDLADSRLRGRVRASAYAKGRPARVSGPVAGLRGRPDVKAGMTTQLLYGDDVLVFEEADGWAWVQAVRDGYVGYALLRALDRPGPAPTHIVSAPRTFLYPTADLKAPRSADLSMGSTVTVVAEMERRGTIYASTPAGEFLVAGHLTPLDQPARDYVSVAEQLLNTPYLWGGATAFGIDCSGLVQLSMRLAGRDVPRDSDMQAASLGERFDPGEDLSGLRRGDLVFWKGHVGIMTDGTTLLHANGHTMLVSRESLADAVERIAHLYGKPTGFRRP